MCHRDTETRRRPIKNLHPVFRVGLRPSFALASSVSPCLRGAFVRRTDYFFSPIAYSFSRVMMNSVPFANTGEQ